MNASKTQGNVSPWPMTCFMSAPHSEWKKASYPASLVAALREEQINIITCHNEPWILPRLIATRGSRLLHTHWLHPYSRGYFETIALLRSARFMARIGAARSLGAKIIWTVHNLHDHDRVRPRLDNLLGKMMATASDALIAHSQVAKQTVVDYFRISPNKVHVVPHGNYLDTLPNEVDRSTARKRLGMDPERFSFLFLGTIRPYKGVPRLIKAFRCIQNPDLQLRIVGRVFEKAKPNGIRILCETDPRIEFVNGFVEDEDIQLHMNAADAVVLPYENILTSGAALMAMSFGKVCVAPRMGTLTDVFAPEGVFHYNSESDGDLQQALEACVGARDDLQRRGARNLAAAREASWAQVARLTKQIYEQVLTEQPRW